MNRISDISVSVPFSVKDLNTGHYIYSIFYRSASIDIPDDIASLPVIGVMVDQKNHYMEIETEVN